MRSIVMPGLILLAVAVPEAVAAQDATRQQASLSRAKGPKDAPVFVYEFADLQCAYCARFAVEVFPRLDSAYVKTGRVQWVFVNLPSPSHINAWAAHEAATCAGAVSDRFWPLHDRLFAGQAEWAEADDPGPVFRRYARDAGVDVGAYDECVAFDRVAPLLLQDVIFATSSRVNGTPAFIVDNQQSVLGLKSYEEWKALLDAALRAKRD
jgi:protein-disulfide isomerase